MKFKGWGTSLAWWANINYSNDVRNKVSELIFGETGLSLNIVRYNLGGGTNPIDPEKTMRMGGLMPCLKEGPYEEFNLENDKYQLSILDEAVKLGVNHIEIFANSPPWWMTKSGKTSGADTISTNNLKDDKIEEYADFLIDSYNILKKRYPISSLAPFNEPSNPFWTSNGSQEGCYFDFSTRNKVIKAIKKKDSNIKLSAADSFSVGFALTWHIFSERDLIDQINIHGYGFGWKGYTLYLDNLTILRKIFRGMTSRPIWMSEFGMGGPNTIDNSLKLARQIYRDLDTLSPEAWIYWQVIEYTGEEGWGLVHMSFSNPDEIIILKQYWVMMHFTKTLREGDTYNFINKDILEIKNGNGKLAYIIVGQNDLANYKKLNVQDIRITDKYRNYKKLEKIPSTMKENSIITFFVTNSN